MAHVSIDQAYESFTGWLSVEAHQAGMPSKEAAQLSGLYGVMFHSFAPLLAAEVRKWKLGLFSDGNSALVMRGIAFIVREANASGQRVARPDVLKATFERFEEKAPKARALIGHIPWPENKPPPPSGSDRLDPRRLP